MEAVTEPIDFATLVGELPDPVIVVDTAVNLRYVNQAGADLFGWRPEVWLGRSILDLIHPDDVASVLSSTGTMQSKRVGTPVEVRVRVADGSWKLVEIVGRNSLDVDGVLGLVVVARDVTKRRMWEVAGSDTVRFQQVVQHASSVTLLLDRSGEITSVNAAFTRLLGHDVSQAVGRPLVSFCVADAANDLSFAIEKAGTDNRLVSCEASMRHHDPSVAALPMRFEIVNLLDDPVVEGLVVTGYDVSELHHTRSTLEHLARHDALTGLVNRSVLIDELDRVVAQRLAAAVIFIDLDKFKAVNDLLGHEAGDELLRTVSQRLLGIVRPGDVVARVGGDEFVIVAYDVNDRQMGQALCERIDATLSMPYLLTEGPMRVAASVGIALLVDDDDATVTGLLADADLAMYEAKAARRGEPERSVTQRQRNANERRRLADDLAAGLQRGEVVAFLQPIVSLDLGLTTSLEALVRWNHPTRGLLSPAAFLDLSEDAGLDLLLGDVVLRSACETLRDVEQQVSLSMNLSVTQLADRGLCERISTILAEYGMEPERLIVEITEHATLQRQPGGGRVSPEHTLHELRDLGASLCLDDFGTGYSSLTHIRRYPLTAIKIDRAFVNGIIDHNEDRAVIAAMVGMAGALDLEVVGEGVETEEQLHALRTIGCDKAQGYLIARPLAPADVKPWIETRGRGWRTPIASASR
jgi:diguanylate cyclase (GGDEF)-like protein/PAS domain S-box-containing protein